MKDWNDRDQRGVMRIKAMSKVFLPWVALLLATVLPANAFATTVFVMSVETSGVQLIVNGTTVRALRIGQSTPEGIRLERIERGAAILTVDGRLVSLGIGQTISPDIMITMGVDGQFRLNAHLNGVPLRAVIDTGASTVAISSMTARRLGIDYQRGRRGISHTANGSVPSYLVLIPQIQIGEIMVRNVTGSVVEGVTISKDIDVLLGNSFLEHVELRRTGNTMLIRRAGGS